MRWNKLAVSLLSTAMVLSQALPAMAQEPQEDHEAGIYPVVEDAYIRKDRSGNTGNFENITKAHGTQYEGKGYKVLNAKENGNTRIIPMMKMQLPTAAEVQQYGWNAYDFVFQIFKNADPGNCPQTYHFYYTTETDWDETKVTWKTKPAGIDKGTGTFLFDFTFEKDDPYEFKPEEEKIIHQDITNAITPLIEQGVEQITIFAAAESSKNTSLMFHAKESTLSSTYIQARHEEYSLTSLMRLIEECRNLQASDYTAASWNNLQKALSAAMQIAADENSGFEEYKNASLALTAAKEALVSAIDPLDPANIAYAKPVRSNLSKTQAERVVDGDEETTWSGQFYPSYLDVDLMEEFDLSDIEVLFPAGKTVSYSLYGSTDGMHYDRLARVRDASSDPGWLKTELEGAKARIVRVYVEGVENQDQAVVSEVRVHGTRSIAPSSYKERSGSLQQMLDVEPYAQSEYAAEITNEEVYENIYGIVERTIGVQCRDWFVFELQPARSEGKDFFEISNKDGKIQIAGNSGVSIARGLNEYYKSVLGVTIAEETMQIPDNLAFKAVEAPILRETDMTVRYAFNYCTISYTFAFFGMEEWQRENDWLALSGVNCVMDLAGQEAVWIEFLMKQGYSFDDAKDWLTGPAYYAWQFMDNMETFGGPISDGYVKDRLEMARKTRRWKNSLGIETIMQGYAGMVPTNFNEFCPEVETIAQGGWGGFTRPSMIKTDSADYDHLAADFYKAQEDMLGKQSHYYAVDPFHEGGKRPADLGDADIAREVLESLTGFDDKAVWIVQGWQSNPTNELLKGMEGYRDEHVLIVDLIKYPISSWTKYDRTKYGSTTLDAEEFNGTPWVWGLLSNFGGNPSMHGQMEQMVSSIQKARKERQQMTGIGIISEAAWDNPVLYDLIFDLAWADESFDLDAWLNEYVVRRYGKDSENLQQAWDLLKDSLYDHGVRYTNELFGCKNKAPQNYGKQTISYGAENLEKALTLMLKEYDALAESETYRYDLCEMLRQQVSNYALLTYNSLLDAKDQKDVETFKALKEQFLHAFDLLNSVQSMNQHQLGGDWIGRAEDRAADYDDFTRDAFVMNAKALITSWGSRSSHRSLKDYGWRNYEGIFLDLYKSVWSEYLDRVQANLETGAPLNNKSVSDYFNLYWKWNLQEQNYTRTPLSDPVKIKELANQVLKECSVRGDADENAGNLALHAIVKSDQADSEQLEKLTDGKNATIATLNPKEGKVQIDFDLMAHFALSSITIRNADSLDLLQVQVSANGTDWQDAAAQEQGTWRIDADAMRFVRVIKTGDKAWKAGEIRIYGEQILPDLDQLAMLVELAESLKAPASAPAVLEAFEQSLADAKAALDEQAPPDTVNAVYWSLYEAMSALDLSETFNAALNKKVTAHNDPSGHSAGLTDGSLSSNWNAGRLSATGKPYETTITPGWAVVDLEKKVSMQQVRIHFAANVWHHYTVSVSDDGENWTQVISKINDAKPQSGGDLWQLEDTAGRYIRIDLLDVQEGSDKKRTNININELIVMAKEWKDPRTDLSTLIERAGALEQQDYTPASWSVFAQALEAAGQAMTDASLSDAQVRSAMEALENAMNALQAKADKRLLDLAVQEADRQIAGGALEHLNGLVRKHFEDALAGAKAVQADANAAQQAVNEAWIRLADAMHYLEFKADTTRLSLLIARAQTLDLQGCTEESIAAFNSALQNAQDVLNNPVSLQASLDAAADSLQQAIDGLETVQDIDISLLELLVQTVEQADLDAYLNENQECEALMQALAAGKAVLFDPQSQQRVDEAAAVLHTAWLNMRLKPDESLLEKIDAFIERVENTDLSSLEKADQNAVMKVYEQAKQARSNPALDQNGALAIAAQIDEAEKLLAGLPSVKEQNGQESRQAHSVRTAAGTQVHAFSAGLGASLAGLWMALKRKRKEEDQ